MDCESRSTFQRDRQVGHHIRIANTSHSFEGGDARFLLTEHRRILSWKGTLKGVRLLLSLVKAGIGLWTEASPLLLWRIRTWIRMLIRFRTDGRTIADRIQRIMDKLWYGARSNLQIGMSWRSAESPSPLLLRLLLEVERSPLLCSRSFPHWGPWAFRYKAWFFQDVWGAPQHSKFQRERLQHKRTFPFFLFPRQTYARLKLDWERDKGSAAVHICMIKV